MEYRDIPMGGSNVPVVWIYNHQPPSRHQHLGRRGGELRVICKERPEPSLGDGMIDPKRALLAHANVGFSQSRLQPCGGLS